MKLFSFPIILVFVLNVSVHSQNMMFMRHPIDLDFDGIHRIKMIDLDGDNDLDIIGGSEITPITASKGLALWINEGNNTWTRFTIDASFIHVMSVDTADINNDSFTDVIASSWQLHQIVWLKNSGDPTQSWTKYIIKSGLTNAHDAQCVDIDDDGDIDIVGVGTTPGSIIVCENDGSLTNWPSKVVTNSFSGALSVYLTDLDKDNYIDIIGTASNLNQIAWWKNNGSNPINWTKKIIASNFVGASGIDVVDMNNDNQEDIISNAWKSNQVAYWICDDIQNNSWTEYNVSSQLDTAAAVQSRDLDQDGDIDIVAVGKIPGELVIYENSNFTWNKIQLQNNFYGGTALEIADLDEDGDDDIIAGASYLGVLYWWENTLYTSVKNDEENYAVSQFYLFQNYPNPFNPATTIDFRLPKSSYVKLSIYDISGRLVETLVNEEKKSGYYTIQWNAEKESSGIYLYRIDAGEFSSVKKCIVVK
ncbi:MAG: T9SS type A sorting domain-containing protein [Bacteroidales bacterium]|nr:T9SS type A sorting domain-containing protein [Bacteroidales bacterium]